MSIPKSYKISRENRNEALSWIQDAGLIDRISYDWVKNVVTFQDDDDALAFSLATNCQRYATLVEEKLRNEESYD